jgi:hypothetical protein
MMVAPYSIMTFTDESGLYKVPINSEGQTIEISLEDRDGDPIIPQTPPYLIISIQSFSDPAREALEQQRELVKLQKLQVLMNAPPA